MADEEQEGFTFVDKRGVAAAAAVHDAAPASPESAPPSPAADAPESVDSAQTIDELESGGHGTDGMPNLPKLDVRDRLLMCIDIMNQGAWITLGLLSDPATGQVEKDLDQAQLAIDVVAFLAGKVENGLDDATRRDLRTLVRDLQLNYVQQKNR